MSINLEQIRKYIREIIKQELEEASVTGNIDGGEGPPKTPHAFSKKKTKNKTGHGGGHRNPAVFDYTKVNEATTPAQKKQMKTIEDRIKRTAASRAAKKKNEAVNEAK